jgi:hypothetical protein
VVVGRFQRNAEAVTVERHGTVEIGDLDHDSHEPVAHTIASELESGRPGARTPERGSRAVSTS